MFNSGFGWKYLALWVILERVGGGLLQFRAHILHFGLWGKEANFFETQIFNSRNIRTNTFTSWYFVHLNFHSVHHAFPTVPFYNLREAHSRLRRLYSASEGRRELIEDTGYFQTALRLVRGLHLARTR
jgi:fatty acid desaturase